MGLHCQPLLRSIRILRHFFVASLILGLIHSGGVSWADENHEEVPFLHFPIDPARFTSITSRYGFRNLFGKSKFHHGVDLAAPQGSLVLAAMAGKIERIGFGSKTGYYVTLLHRRNWRTSYYHLMEHPRKQGLKVGMLVLAGSPLGRVGQTGRATGPHLHFELMSPSGKTCDPLWYMLSLEESHQRLLVMRTNRKNGKLEEE